MNRLDYLGLNFEYVGYPSPNFMTLGYPMGHDAQATQIYFYSRIKSCGESAYKTNSSITVHIGRHPPLAASNQEHYNFVYLPIISNNPDFAQPGTCG